MNYGDLSGKRVAVVATDYFEETELTEPVKALRKPDDLSAFNKALIGALSRYKYYEHFAR